MFIYSISNSGCMGYDVHTYTLERPDFDLEPFVLVKLPKGRGTRYQYNGCVGVNDPMYHHFGAHNLTLPIRGYEDEVIADHNLFHILQEHPELEGNNPHPVWDLVKL